MRRRRFIQAMGAWAVGSLAVSSHSRATEQHEVSRSAKAFGTQVSLRVRHADAQHAAAACDRALAELQRIERLMSVYRADSQVGQLNREGQLANPHPDLLAVLREAETLSRHTHGAFDITVQPLWNLFRAKQLAGTLPTEDEIRATRSLVDYRQLVLEDDLVRFQQPHMQITVNGIAQGFAADRVAALLRDEGIHDALVDTGEMAAFGAKDVDREWRVGLQHPRQPDAFQAVVELEDRCLATSGDYEATFTDDYRLHHIFDPHSGRSPVELASVSVVAPTALQADGWSTAVMVLGLERAAKLLSAFPRVAALCTRKDGTVVAIGDFPIASG